MNISDNTSRLVSTLAIWSATAVIFIFGFCQMNVDGLALIFWGVIGTALAVGPTMATMTIWKPTSASAAKEVKPADQPPA